MEQTLARSTPGKAADVKPQYHSGWDRWVVENALKGVPVSKLRAAMLRHGFAHALVEERIGELLSHPAFDVAKTIAARHNKTVSLMRVLSHLQDRSDPYCEVEAIEHLSPDRFYSEFVCLNRPVLAAGLIKGWPAVSKWSGRYFLECAGNKTFEISDARDADARFEENFREHVTTTSLAGFVERLETSQGNDFYLCAKHNFLANSWAAPLLDDFSYPVGFLDDTASKHRASLWMGPAGTWTPFHHDASNNLFCQVAGAKRVHMVAPIHLARLYNSRHCFSDIDPRAVDLERFPEMKGVPIHRVVVAAGDALLIPVGWWHCVESLAPSISITLSNLLLPRQANVWTWR